MSPNSPDRIPARPSVGSRERTSPKFPFSARVRPVITNEEFKDLLQGVINDPKQLELNLPELFFVVKLEMPYDQDKQIINALETKKIKVIQVVDSTTLLVSAKTKDLHRLFEQKKISLDLLGRVRWLGVLSPNEKLGDSIVRVLKNANAKTTIPIRIFLPREIGEQDLRKIVERVRNIAKDASFSSFGNSFSAVCNKAQIDQLLELPFVQKMSTESGSKGQSEKPKERMFETAIISPAENELASVCILDCGISKTLAPFCDTDTLISGSVFDEDQSSHGTEVCSVALFGDALTETSRSNLSPTTKVISVKIAKDKEDGPTEAEFGEMLTRAILKHKKQTRIYSVSFCYPHDMDLDLRRRFAQDLDKLLFKENILLINAAGNVAEGEELTGKDANKLPVLAPSDSHLIFTVGSGKVTNNKFVKSSISRFGRSPIFLNTGNDLRRFLKPDIFSNGGDINTRNVKGTLTAFFEPRIRVINSADQFTFDAGTSFAAPLLANKAAQIEKKYGAKYKTAEILKSILLSKCEMILKGKKQAVLVYPATLDPCLANDAVYIDFEWESVPTIEAPKGKSKRKINCITLEIPVDERIKSIDLFTCHSTSHSDFDPTRHVSKIMVEALLPDGKTRAQRAIGNMGDYAAVTYARYGCGSEKRRGAWKFSFHLEAKWISKSSIETLESRLGVSFRVNVRPRFKHEIDQIYESVRAHILKEKLNIAIAAVAHTEQSKEKQEASA